MYIQYVSLQLSTHLWLLRSFSRSAAKAFSICAISWRQALSRVCACSSMRSRMRSTSSACFFRCFTY